MCENFGCQKIKKFEVALSSPEDPRICTLTTSDSLQAYKEDSKGVFMKQLSYQFVALEMKYYMQSMLKQLFAEISEYLPCGGNQAEWVCVGLKFSKPGLNVHT